MKIRISNCKSKYVSEMISGSILRIVSLENSQECYIYVLITRL